MPARYSRLLRATSSPQRSYHTWHSTGIYSGFSTRRNRRSCFASLLPPSETTRWVGDSLWQAPGPSEVIRCAHGPTPDSARRDAEARLRSEHVHADVPVLLGLRRTLHGLHRSAPGGQKGVASDPVPVSAEWAHNSLHRLARQYRLRVNSDRAIPKHSILCSRFRTSFHLDGSRSIPPSLRSGKNP